MTQTVGSLQFKWQLSAPKKNGAPKMERFKKKGVKMWVMLKRQVLHVTLSRWGNL